MGKPCNSWVLESNENTLKILSSDPNYIKEGRYVFLVMKNNDWDIGQHLYQVKFTTGKLHINIMEGQPELGNLVRDKIQYYRYNMVNFKDSIKVIVTPFSGDPDLYVSVNRTNDRPNFSNYDYISSSVGSDIINIPISEYISKSPDCVAIAFLQVSWAVFSLFAGYYY